MPIERIKIGDKVLSYDEKTKQFEYKLVAQTFIAVKENIVKIKIRGERLLTTTTEHPFYVKKTYRAGDSLSSAADDEEEGEWLTAAELRVGQKVLRPDGRWTRITHISESTEPTLVYNLEVESNHNYFVGKVGVLSHNCGFLTKLTKTDASMFGRAIEIAASGKGTFTENLIALTKAVREIRPDATLNDLGKYGGSQVYGSLVSGVGIVEKEGVTIVVRKVGDSFEELGKFLPQ